MFRPDQPIQNSKEDILGRRYFSKALGESILKYKGKESIVVGLFGEWGSGKTSIINLALEQIAIDANKLSDENKPIVLRFNPWNFSDQLQLISQYFKQLSIALERPDYNATLKHAGKKLEIYAKFFEPLSYIPPTAPFGVIAKLLSKFGKNVKEAGEANSQNLSAIRKDLNDDLRNLDCKIIVVIDDIDRLNDIEIRQIFQLVKSLGDFPNTIYLLAFDKKVVINALENVQKALGKQYLEKIVQVPFEVPLISKTELENLLFSQLDELIAEVPEKKWDKAHWTAIYQDGLRPFISNIRDVNRYINALRFSYGMVKENVNVIDFLAIIGIQVFVPDVYYGIRDNNNLFSGVFDLYPSHSRDAEKDDSKKRIAEIIDRADEKYRENLRTLLKKLFPKLEAIYGNRHYGTETLGEWRKESRICSPDVFDTYFQLALKNSEISNGEMEMLLNLGNDTDKFKESLVELQNEEKIVRFLDRTEDFTRDSEIIPKENVKNIVISLMDVADAFPDGPEGFFAIDTPMRVMRIIYQLSQRFDTQEERFKLFKKAMEASNNSIYTMVHEIGIQDQQHGRYGSKERPDPDELRSVNGEQLDQLEAIAADKIRKWAKDGRLVKQPKLLAILYRWKEWGSEEEVIEFVESMTETDEGLVVLVACFVHKVTSYGETIEEHWQVNLDTVKDFLDLDSITSRLRKIRDSIAFKKMPNEKKRAVNIFLDMIDGKIKQRF